MTTIPPEPPLLRARINDFAIRTFRDTADGDYITARLAHRAELIPQFLWSGLQAIEKYLKGILLINRIPSQKATHGIVGLLAKVEAITKLRINVAKETRDFIQYLDDNGQFRYLEVSYHAQGADLSRLDRTVWELRRYCALLDYTQTRTDGTTVSRLEGELQLLERASAHPRRFRLHNGYLEKIIDDPKHAARPGLIWNNMYYGRSKRQSVTLSDWFTSVNAPLAASPDLVTEVKKYAYLPKPLIKELELILQQQQP